MVDNNATIFQYELNPGERIIWSGQPQQGVMLRTSDLIMIPFSLLWGGFAIFWELTAVSMGAPFFFMLWGIPFVLIGLYMIIGRFILDAVQRRKIYYALTHERVIIISGLFNTNIKSLTLKKLPEINLSQRGERRGTITFGTSHPMAWISAGNGFPSMGRYPVAPSFEMIDDVNIVYQHIKRLQREGN